MATVREHLKAFHEATAASHIALGKTHAALAEHYSGLQESAAGDDEASHFAKLAAAHSEMAGQHAEAGSYNLTCCKSMDKAAGMSGDEEKDANLHLNRIVPDNVRGIMPQEAPPSVRAVPRHGAPELVDKAGVPVEFQKLIEVE